MHKSPYLDWEEVAGRVMGVPGFEGLARQAEDFVQHTSLYCNSQSNTNKSVQVKIFPLTCRQIWMVLITRVGVITDQAGRGCICCIDNSQQVWPCLLTACGVSASYLSPWSNAWPEVAPQLFAVAQNIHSSTWLHACLSNLKFRKMCSPQGPLRRFSLNSSRPAIK